MIEVNSPQGKRQALNFRCVSTLGVRSLVTLAVEKRINGVYCN